LRLGTKLLLLLVPMVVIPILALGGFAYHKLHRLAVSQQESQIRTQLTWLARDFERMRATARANIRLFANDVLVRKYLHTRDAELRYTLLLSPLLRLFRSYQQAFPKYREIRIVLPDGTEDVVQSTLKADGARGWDPDLFRALTKKGDFPSIDVRWPPSNGLPLMYVAVPLESGDLVHSSREQVRAYMVLTVSLKSLVDRMASARVGRHGLMLAVDDQGRPLIPGRGFDAVLLHRLPNLPKDRFTALEGETEWFAMRHELMPGVHLVSMLPASELRESSRDLAFVTGWVTLLTILVLLLSFLLVMRQLVVRPLATLRGFTGRLARGEEMLDVDGFSNDEIGDLARAFREMSLALRDSYSRIRHLAYHDQLTGLPNRSRFLRMVQEAIGNAARHHESFALLFLDLDGFKCINDNFGHQVGDRLLRSVAQQLAQTLRGIRQESAAGSAARARDLLSRIGGDEFIVLLADISSPDVAGLVAQRLIDTLSRPVEIEGHECVVGVSIGISLFPQNADDAGELIKYADIAMYHAKSRGRNTWEYYTPELNRAANRYMRLETRLRRAIAEERLELAFQPQVRAQDREPVAVEALARWKDEEHGDVGPNEFIAIAERSGLILELGRLVLFQACRLASRWPRPINVAVNVSAIQFQHQDLVALVRQALSESGLNPARLELEITETSIMADPAEAARILAQIRQLGVSMALDDFGSGYSALSSLRRFPLDVLKMDRGLVAGIDRNHQDRQIARSILDMAHTLGLDVVAEGVERPTQADILRGFGCDRIQGYWVSRPLTPDALQAWLGAAPADHAVTRFRHM